MPKINVYLPDDLADAVRQAGIPVSSVCQRALADAVVAADGPPLAGAEPDRGVPPELSRFTRRARHAIDHAGACRERTTSVELVGGLVAEGNNLALLVLRSLDVDPSDLVAELAALAGSQQARADDLAAVLRRAVDEALALGHNFVGCEHLLLGLLTGPEGELTADTLRAMGVNAQAGRRTVTAALRAVAFGRDNRSRAGVSAPIRSALDDIQNRLARLESRDGRDRRAGAGIS